MTKKLGRPAVLSSDLILTAALEVAAADPVNPVSMSAVARHLKVTPMAIYSYFANRDELLQAMSRRLLDGLVLEATEGLGPIERVVAWAHGVRRHFLTYPELFNMLAWEGGHGSIAWLNRSHLLFEALKALGLDDERLPVITLSIWNTVMSTIMYELHDRRSDMRIADAEYESLDSNVRGPIGRIREFMASDDCHEQLFAFQVERLADYLSRMAGRSGR